MNDVLVVGDVNVDIITSKFKIEKKKQQKVENIFATKGGEAFNFACAGSKLGMKIKFIGKIGNDSFGEFLIKKAGEFGINKPIQTKGKTGVSISLTQDDRKFITFRGENENLKMGDIKLEDIKNSKFFYLGGIWHLKSLQKDIPDLFKRARKFTTTILNIGFDYEGEKQILKKILPHVDIFFLNHEELKQIRFSIKQILDMGVKIIVLHKGNKGSELITKNKRYYSDAAAKEKKVRNPTGAGDIFNAGFVYCLLNEWDFEKSLKFANACGAIHVIKEKDFVPSYTEVLRFGGF